MPGAFNTQVLIPSGANTNQTSPSKPVQPDVDFATFRMVCEAIGATPAITWQIFGSFDETTVPDAASLWEPMGWVSDGKGGSPDNVVFTSRTGPVVAGDFQTMTQATTNRRFRKFRCVVTGILNVTYRVEMFTTDSG